MHILIHTNNTFLLQLHSITYIEVLSNYVVGVIRGADRDCHLILLSKEVEPPCDRHARPFSGKMGQEKRNTCILMLNKRRR